MRIRSKFIAWFFVLLGFQIGGCADFFEVEEAEPRHDVGLKGRAKAALSRTDMSASDPMLIRIFKAENKLEVWKKPKGESEYQLLTTYDICAYSGKLGPKFKTGDKQAPEGFYWVGRSQMNPYSRFHLSFNLGYPNAFDRANGRTGAHLMVHGNCVSAGCYAMTNRRIEEIYALVREAHKGGQKSVQVQAFPFRMTDRNMKARVGNPNFAFWQNLKEGYDAFENTRQIVKVNVCEKRYLFNQRTKNPGATFRSRGKCPATVPIRPPKVLESKPSQSTEVQATKDKKKPVKRVDGVIVESTNEGKVKLIF